MKLTIRMQYGLAILHEFLLVQLITLAKTWYANCIECSQNSSTRHERRQVLCKAETTL